MAIERTVNTSKSITNPDTNNPNLDEDGEQEGLGENDDVNGSPERETDVELENDAKDTTPRIYSIGMQALAGSEHTDVIVQYASPTGPHVKRKIFMGPVTAYQLAQALLDVDVW